jgi:hypothetical protein
VDELYVSQVRPAPDEIDQLVHDNLSFRELATRAATDKAGPVAGVGVGTVYGLAVGGSPLLTSAVALALTGGTSLLRAMHEERVERRKIEADQFYFLYETNQRL